VTVSSGTVYSFGPFQLDARSKRLTRDGERVGISDRHVSVLQHLLANAGSIVSKDALIAAAWEDVAVTDNSLEQVISALRRLMGDAPDGRPRLETVPRRGYRFAGDVSRVVPRESDETLVRQALETDEFAAEFVAETVAAQIERRWNVLEREASEPDVRQMLDEVSAAAAEVGLTRVGSTPSPITGQKGNVEFLCHFRAS